MGGDIFETPVVGRRSFLHGCKRCVFRNIRMRVDAAWEFNTLKRILSRVFPCRNKPLVVRSMVTCKGFTFEGSFFVQANVFSVQALCKVPCKERTVCHRNENHCQQLSKLRIDKILNTMMILLQCEYLFNLKRN